MKPTIEYVKEKFQEFNQLCFDGVLPMPLIVLSRSRRTLGQLAYLRQRLPDGSVRRYNFSLKISNLIDRDDRVVEDTIIHEMIHYYILYHDIYDTSSHGRRFQWWMNRINRKFGRNITITHRSTPQEKDADTQKRHHLVCIIRFRDGSRGVMIVPRTRIFMQWDAPRKFADVEEYGWYMSIDPFFNRYPRSISVKAYNISKEDVEIHLSGAVQLGKTGDTIRPVRKL